MYGRRTVKPDTEVATFDPRAPRHFWLDGSSVMCACPDCHAPISIRLWLMVADCWQCGCSIELTEAQERQIQSLLRRERAANETQTPNQRAHQKHKTPPTPASKRTSPKPPQQQPRRPSQPAPKRAPRKPISPPTAAGPPTLFQQSPKRSLRDWLNQMPAWLISMLFHMALLALLALLMFEGDPEEDPYITLSTEVKHMDQMGGEVAFDNPQDDFEYDLPIPPEDAPKTPQQQKALAKAAQDAKELRVDPAASNPQLPALQQVKEKLRSTDSIERTLAARDPRVRAEIVTKEGGTTMTEAAVARGLRWLAMHQSSDGSWSLHGFNNSRSCNCRGNGHVHSDSAGTSLALLPFLGAGQTHQTGIYKNTVARGLRWLMDHQREDGDLSARSSGNAAMYAHGQGAIVLCEAYALTFDEQLRVAAQKSIDFIVEAQHGAGGWRYKPGERGDTSVLGWQLMALQSARAAGLTVPQETLDLAGFYLDSVQYDDGSRYAYQPNRRPTHVMTAEALLCRMYLGWSKDFAGLTQGVRYLTSEHMPGEDGPNFYYWYYATQTLHHHGGRSWKKWNRSMREILVDLQRKRGHQAGSWDPQGGHASQAGRIYSTALAVCTLEVYYRHAPIFRQLELED